MRHDPLYIPSGPIDDAPGAWTRAVGEARDAERRADAAATKAFATRETAAKWRDAAARSLADHLVDNLAGVHAQAASLTAEYALRRDAWVVADEEYHRAFASWMRAYEQRKQLEDDDLEGGGGDGA